VSADTAQHDEDEESIKELVDVLEEIRDRFCRQEPRIDRLMTVAMANYAWLVGRTWWRIANTGE
jgi:hypothetical protein